MVPERALNLVIVLLVYKKNVKARLRFPLCGKTGNLGRIIIIRKNKIKK